MDNFVLQCFAFTLEAAQHRTPAIDKSLPLKKTIGRIVGALDPARLFCAVYAERYTNAPSFTVGDDTKEPLKGKLLPTIQDALAVGVGRVAIHEVALRSLLHRLLEIGVEEGGSRSPAPPNLYSFGE